MRPSGAPLGNVRRRWEKHCRRCGLRCSITAAMTRVCGSPDGMRIRGKRDGDRWQGLSNARRGSMSAFTGQRMRGRTTNLVDAERRPLRDVVGERRCRHRSCVHTSRYPVRSLASLEQGPARAHASLTDVPMWARAGVGSNASAAARARASTCDPRPRRCRSCSSWTMCHTMRSVACTALARGGGPAAYVDSGSLANELCPRSAANSPAYLGVFPAKLCGAKSRSIVANRRTHDPYAGWAALCFQRVCSAPPCQARAGEFPAPRYLSLSLSPHENAPAQWR